MPETFDAVAYVLAHAGDRFFPRRSGGQPFRVARSPKDGIVFQSADGANLKSISAERFNSFCARYATGEISPASYTNNPGSHAAVFGFCAPVFDWVLKTREAAVTTSPEEAEREARKRRLAAAPKQPEKYETTVTRFRRNPDVVAEALDRAEGICRRCQEPAPFAHGRTGEPFLEVHHIVPLSEGGLDCVENAEALCPNCHREKHWGPNGLQFRDLTSNGPVDFDSEPGNELQ